MSTRAEQLPPLNFIDRVVDLIKGTEINFLIQGKVRTAPSATSVANTLNVPESAIQEYQSIMPLKGMFANDPSWNNLPDFLENYWQETDETVETD